MPVFTPAVPPCTPAMVTLAVDASDGDFNGMSHSGTWLVVANRGSQACTLIGLPMVAMKDAKGAMLPVARKAPVGMHPGPVVVPVRLEPGATARMSLRWVSGEVYDNSQCVDAAKVEVTFGKLVLGTALQGHLCGEHAATIPFEQSPLSHTGAPVPPGQL